MDDISTTVSILLQKGWYDCLRRNAASDSVAAKCLERALDIRGVLAGSLHPVRQLRQRFGAVAVLELATEHCREAVGEIREGLRRFNP